MTLIDLVEPGSIFVFGFGVVLVVIGYMLGRFHADLRRRIERRKFFGDMLRTFLGGKGNGKG